MRKIEDLQAEARKHRTLGVWYRWAGGAVLGIGLSEIGITVGDLAHSGYISTADSRSDYVGTAAVAAGAIFLSISSSRGRRADVIDARLLAEEQITQPSPSPEPQPTPQPPSEV